MTSSFEKQKLFKESHNFYMKKDYNLAHNLLVARKKLKRLQSEMAELTGVTRGTWSNYENGYSEPDIPTLIKISKGLGINIDDLILGNLENEKVIGGNEHLKKSKGNCKGNCKGNDESIPNCIPNCIPNSDDQQNNSSESRSLEEAITPLIAYLKALDEKVDRIARNVEK